MDKSLQISDPEKDLITITDFKITSADTDMEARLRPGALFSFLAHAAYLSADNLGFGYKHLKEHNLFWVLSRLEVHIKRPLIWNETIEVETWPKDIDGLLYIRDFLVRDKEGEIVARAGSSWLAIDSVTKRPKRKDSFDSDIFVYHKDKCGLKDPPKKLRETSGGDVFKLNSTYFDLDLNKHVTSSRYIDWMMDTFSLDFHREHYPKLLSINFVKETLPGSEIKMRREKGSEDEYRFEGENTGLGKISFRGTIVF